MILSFYILIFTGYKPIGHKVSRHIQRLCRDYRYRCHSYRARRRFLGRHRAAQLARFSRQGEAVHLRYLAKSVAEGAWRSVTERSAFVQMTVEIKQ